MNEKEIVGKNIKLVYKDGENNKAVVGELVNTDEFFFYILQENKIVLIAKKEIVSVKVTE